MRFGLYLVPWAFTCILDAMLVLFLDWDLQPRVSLPWQSAASWKFHSIKLEMEPVQDIIYFGMRFQTVLNRVYPRDLDSDRFHSGQGVLISDFTHMYCLAASSGSSKCSSRLAAFGKAALVHPPDGPFIPLVVCSGSNGQPWFLSTYRPSYTCRPGTAGPGSWKRFPLRTPHWCFLSVEMPILVHQGQWSSVEKSSHIGYLEPLSVWLALQVWGSFLRATCVMIVRQLNSSGLPTMSRGQPSPWFVPPGVGFPLVMPLAQYFVTRTPYSVMTQCGGQFHE